MAAPAFYWIPSWVTPKAPVFPVLITPSESFKKDYQLLDSDAIWRYDLTFTGVSDSGRNAILRHYSGWSGGAAVGGGATGPFQSFNWTSIPSYLNQSGSSTVRYVPGSYKESPKARSWDIRLTFEVDV